MDHAGRWPRTTGVSLLLVPVDHRDQDWAKAEAVVRSVVEPLGVGVAKGLAHSPSYVRAGAEALLGASGCDVLVFACPADIGLFESAPLVHAATSGVMIEETASFFRRVSDAALGLSPKIAWVVAHEWTASDRVRWHSGDVEALVHFATSPGAWRTSFLGPRVGLVVESDEWPCWFEVQARVEGRQRATKP